MRVAILGPLEVRRDDDVVAVPGGRVRALLARLALDAGREVGRDALIDAIWDGDPPGDATHALQALVSRLRRVLGSDAVTNGATGYVLTVAPDDVDALRFEALARNANGAALGLWRGPALGEFDQRFARAAADRLEDLRLAVTAGRIEADLASGGDPSALVAELDTLTAAHPLNERLAAVRLTALAAAGRQADALDAYEQLRRRLDEELGALPSAEVQAAQLAVVNGTATRPRVEPARRTNLRFGVTSFVGRDEELERLDLLLDRERLVTLIGPGGAGKTRLATEIAGRRAAHARDGAWMVELASVTDPADVDAATLGALGLREARTVSGTGVVPGQADGHTDAITHLLDVLAERDAVLVLDNCEHVIGAAAVLADRLLAHCPALRIVATSREPLGIMGEHLSQVAPLGTPPADATPAEALTHPAVRLFADRAAAAAPGFEVDDATVAPVVEICRRLDGLPLALELAAARLRSLSVTQIAERLDDRFRLLTGGSRAALPRQRTLRAVVDWSWDLLSEPERALARRIAVFPAGVTPETAEAVCAGDDLPARDVPDLLAALADRSLVVLADPAGAPRYRMLETIREYGTEKLEEAGELGAIRTAHARHFAGLVDEADLHLRGRDQLEWFHRLQAERENVLAGLRWLAETGDADAAIRCAVSLGWFWLLSGSPNDGAAALRLALEVPGDSDPLDRLIAESLVSFGESDAENLDEEVKQVITTLREMDLTRRPVVVAAMPLMAWITGNTELADELFTRAETHPDPWVRAAVPLARAQWAENFGDVPAMREHLDLALARFRETGDRWGLTATLNGMAGLYLLEDDLDGAAAALEEAQSLLAELGADAEHAFLHMRLADVRQRQGDQAGALWHARRARDATDLGGSESAMAGAAMARILWLAGARDEAREALAQALVTLDRTAQGRRDRGHLDAIVRGSAAVIELEDGNVEVARELLERAFPVAVATDDLPVVGMVGLAIVRLAIADGLPREAAEDLGAAARLRGSPDATNIDVVELTTRLRDELGDDGFTAAFEAGRALDRDAAIARLDPQTLRR